MAGLSRRKLVVRWAPQARRGPPDVTRSVHEHHTTGVRSTSQAHPRSSTAHGWTAARAEQPPRVGGPPENETFRGRRCDADPNSVRTSTPSSLAPAHRPSDPHFFPGAHPTSFPPAPTKYPRPTLTRRSGAPPSRPPHPGPDRCPRTDRRHRTLLVWIDHTTTVVTHSPNYVHHAGQRPCARSNSPPARTPPAHTPPAPPPPAPPTQPSNCTQQDPPVAEHQHRQHAAQTTPGTCRTSRGGAAERHSVGAVTSSTSRASRNVLSARPPQRRSAVAGGFGRPGRSSAGPSTIRWASAPSWGLSDGGCNWL